MYSRHDVFISSGPSSSSVKEELSFINILRKPAVGAEFDQFLLFRTGVGAEFDQFLLFKKFCEFLLVFTEQFSLYFGIPSEK